MNEINYKAKFLEGEDIYLRPFEKEDVDFFYKWYNDFDTRAKIGEVYPTSFGRAEKMIDRTNKDSVWFTIVRKTDDKIIGETGLLRMFFEWGTTDLSIIIPDEKDQHKGYGKQAIKLIMDYAFGYLNFNRIAIGVVGFNENALKFYEKVGFKKEGIQEEGYYYNYKYYDFVMMRILKKEYVK